MTAPLSYVHRFEPGEAPTAPPLLLLHGTGGDENDLLPVGRMVAPGAALLSPRGDVLERGMPRFFRRFAEGVFDEDDVRRRAGALADFITDARKAYGIAAPVALGYSNGANIAAAVLLLRPHILAGAILWRAMMPLSEPQLAPLPGTPVLMLSGARDPIATPAEAARLKSALQTAGAAVEHRVLPVGHELSQSDVAIAHQWLQERRRNEGAGTAAIGQQPIC